MGKPTLVDSNEITLVDFEKIANATRPLDTNTDILHIIETLKEAFSNKKVVFIINHGIAEQEVKYVFSIFDRFLALPTEVKEKFMIRSKKDYHGYAAQNVEQFNKDNKIEMRESFNIVGHDRTFPEEEIPEFSQCVGDITIKFRKIANLLLELFAIGMDTSSDFLLRCHENMWNHLYNLTTCRIMYYPPVEEPQARIIRCGEHTDFCTLTMLMQDSEGGLEICDKNGEWRRVGHIPGAIFLNTADFLEIWSSGLYKSILHRVVVPEEADTWCQSRHSMAFFVQPDNDATIKPVQPLSGKDFKECNAGEYIRMAYDKQVSNF